MGHVDTLNYADQLASMISARSESYTTTYSERNNLLRYIALVYSEQSRTKEACGILALLCKHNPEIASFRREYAFALNNDSQYELAEIELNKAIRLQPSNAKSHAQLGRILCRSGRTNSGYNCYFRAATLEPDNASYTQHLLYWGNYIEQVTQEDSYRLSLLWASKIHASISANNQHIRDTAPNRQLKLAFVCLDINDPDTSPFLSPLLSGLDNVDYNITVYNGGIKSGPVSTPEWCQQTLVDCSQMNDQEMANRISTDKIDILVDIDGHSPNNRLGVFASRPAPVQANWLGYPSTTGLNAIGYKITDRVIAPTDRNQDCFSESLLRLPGGFVCYSPPKDAPEIALNKGHPNTRFGAFSNLSKVSSLTLDCWAAAILNIPESTLTIIRYELNNPNVAGLLLKELARRGVAHDRVILKAPQNKDEQLLDAYNEIDITLDTSPYNNTRTTLESLWMGVPVISLTGQNPASRMTASVLSRLNLSGLATQSVFEFAERAKELSEVKDTLEGLRSSLRNRMQDSALMNNKQFAREFGNSLRSQWRDWCRTSSNTLDDQASQAASSAEVDR